ncbi:hypothetical protein [Hyphomonas johnsonii]|uniref:Lipoprotein n=1 Tax=Hyphomonas johnsonii MHS-2 TaxID=1280950 RepID=A0A059FCR7_9PROT|nr:hypothetical protein [Hyphomonas johnsonii]KCZ88323.1 hypothetical protein HJO_15713 [Hyphomonas johnsonii MHS-2]
MLRSCLATLAFSVIITQASAQVPEAIQPGSDSYVVDGVHHLAPNEENWEDSVWNERISSRFVTGLPYEKVCIQYFHSSKENGYTDFPRHHVSPWDEWVGATEADLGLMFHSNCMPVEQYLVGTWQVSNANGETLTHFKQDGHFDAVFHPEAGGTEQQFSGKFRVSDEDSGYFHLLARLDPAPGEEAVTILNLMQIDRDGRLQNLTAQAEAVRLVGH